MIRYVNHLLSSSRHEQSHDANFGVGAKVAAATRNHAGLVYLSWKDGHGWMTHLWRDPGCGQYGLARAEREEGSFHDYLPIADDVKPAVIDGHGTMVVPLGMTDEHNTVEPPEGVEGRQRWISKYLNTRYFSLWRRYESEGDSDACNGERARGSQPDPDVPSSDRDGQHRRTDRGTEHREGRDVIATKLPA